MLLAFRLILLSNSKYASYRLRIEASPLKFAEYIFYIAGYSGFFFLKALYALYELLQFFGSDAGICDIPV